MAHSESPSAPHRRLVLVRHGHYERVGDLGDEVWGLTALGRRQAARTGRRLARLLGTADGIFEGLYSSPWPRAVQTAEIIAHEIEADAIKIKPYLHECVPLVPANDPRLIRAGYEPTPPADRASTVAQLDRILARFCQPVRRSCVCIVACHGNLIRYVVAHALGLPYEAWMKMEIHHAAVTELRIYATDVIALAGYNDTGHMPPELVTT